VAKKNSGLFRKAALDHLSSPDELDRALRVTGPRAWLALSALAAIVVMAVIWSIVGSIPTQVSGQGILLHAGGVSQIVSTSAGRLTGVAVKAGDLVEAGESLGMVAQPELVVELENARAELTAALVQRDTLAHFQEIDAQQQMTLFESQRAEATRTIAEATEQARWYAERVKAEESLFAQRLLLEDKLFDTRRSAVAELARAEAARTKLKEIALAEIAWRNRATQEQTTARLQSEKFARAVAALEARMRTAAVIASPTAGRVVEVIAANGQLVAAGEAVLNVEPRSGPLEALIYVPAADGKKVRAGMSVRVSPATVKPEEFGYMLATVRSVSSFPATTKGMMRVLQNERLVTSLSATGTPFELYATLTLDPGTVSGYRWTSGAGPAIALFSGTPVVALVTERTRRPIELILPFVRSLFGL
jgi:HlyD family secretion protein